MSAGSGWGGPRWAWAGLVVLVLALALGFHRDVRDRDALSWMDPHQYYEFALGVLEGRERATEFEVPSIFPFLLLPALSLSPSIPSALWSNFAFTLLVLPVLSGLRRALGIRSPTWLVALLVCSSPLLLGLSRSLYVEYALSVLVAGAAWLWLRVAEQTDGRRGLLFSAVFAIGLMLKMTFPLFLLPPIAGVVVARLASGRQREVGRLAACVLLPVVFVLAIEASVFTRAFGYYLSLGNTSVPIMRLIGPPEWLSWSSAWHYFGELGRTLLFLLTPLLALALWQALRRRGPLGWRDLASPRAQLWLWGLGPLVLLTLQPVKEPRHVAPCVVPAVLLIVLGIEALPARLSRAASALALLLALLQLALVGSGRRETPYYMTGPLHWDRIEHALIESDPIPGVGALPEAARRLLWRYRHDFVIEGFSANESLALTWLAFPGVVYDLETLADPARLSDAIPYQRFEDLYVLTAFNTYNRRCGHRWYYETLPRDVVSEHADFVLLSGVGEEEARRRYPHHAAIAAIEREAGTIRILRASRSTDTPYRALYAGAFLERHPALPDAELRVVAKELFMAASLGGYEARARALLRRFPFLAEGGRAPRNIYWIGGYELLDELAFARVRAPAGR